MSEELKYIDPECYGDEQDNRLHTVSGYMAGMAYNDICKMLGGRWPDCRLEAEAPKAHKFFMALFSEVGKGAENKEHNITKHDIDAYCRSNGVVMIRLDDLEFIAGKCNSGAKIANEYLTAIRGQGL